MTDNVEEMSPVESRVYESAKTFYELYPAKTCVVTHIFNKSGKELLDISQYFLISYSQKIFADYFCIYEAPTEKHLIWYSSLKYFFDLLNTYDRIIYIDPDAIVSPDCPDLTQVCPEDMFGAYFESDVDSRISCIDAARLIYGEIPGWTQDYFNMGVMVLSKKHQELFRDATTYLMSEQHIQTFLNWRLFKEDLPYMKLDAKFNYQPGLFGGVPGDAHIVHFAGAGRTFGKLISNKHNMDAWVERESTSGSPTFERQKDAAILSMKIYQMRDMAASLRENKTQFSMGAPMFAFKPSIDRFLDRRGLFYVKLPDISMDCAVTGPYVTVMPGFYRIFLDGPENPENRDVEIEFDICSNQGRLLLLSRRQALLSELTRGIAFRVFAVAEDVEFRITLIGRGFHFYAMRLEPAT